MNSDYYTPHRTTLGKATIRELLDTLNGKKNFPMRYYRNITHLLTKEVYFRKEINYDEK